jgi:hypothetical protein
MNQSPNIPVVVVPLEQLNAIIESYFKMFKDEIIKIMESRNQGTDKNPYVTYEEFMKATKICRTTLDNLVKGNLIKSIKKSRKIYIPSTEIDRYFNDPSIK